MNLNLITPKNQTEDLLFSVTKNCETPIRQTRTRPEKTLDFKRTKSGEKIQFKPPVPIEGSYLIGLTNLEVYNSIFNVTEDNNNFKLFTFPVPKRGGVTYEKVKHGIEKDFDNSNLPQPIDKMK